MDHPPLNLLDEVMSQEFEKLGRELEADETVRVVVLQSALLISLSPTLVCAALQAARKWCPIRRSFRLTQMIGERFQKHAQGDHCQSRGTGPGRRE